MDVRRLLQQHAGGRVSASLWHRRHYVARSDTRTVWAEGDRFETTFEGRRVVATIVKVQYLKHAIAQYLVQLNIDRGTDRYYLVNLPFEVREGQSWGSKLLWIPADIDGNVVVGDEDDERRRRRR